jgi:hypothetical protein
MKNLDCRLQFHHETVSAPVMMKAKMIQEQCET